VSPKPGGGDGRKPGRSGEPARGRATRKPSSERPEARAAGRGAAGGHASDDGARRRAVTALSHVAIATPDADALAQTLVAALGAERGEEEMLDGGALRVLFVRIGPLTFELLEPRSAEHTVARFLEKRGPGLHHVSLEAADLEQTLERCRAAGVQLIDQSPRPGAHGTHVAFLHPKSLGGVLVELSERSRATPRRAR
jgi:methylmalonyl-CoA/ethylmalonyl-CoA epimerase